MLMGIRVRCFVFCLLLKKIGFCTPSASPHTVPVAVAQKKKKTKNKNTKKKKKKRRFLLFTPLVIAWASCATYGVEEKKGDLKYSPFVTVYSKRNVQVNMSLPTHAHFLEGGTGRGEKMDTHIHTDLLSILPFTVRCSFSYDPPTIHISQKKSYKSFFVLLFSRPTKIKEGKGKRRVGKGGARSVQQTYGKHTTHLTFYFL